MVRIHASRREDEPPLSVLLLADDDPGHADTILEHINALIRHSRHRVSLYNPRWVRRSLALDFGAFDVVVIHYSIVSIVDSYLSPAFRDALSRFRGLKVQIIQDDYRWVEDFRGMMRRLGISVLFTLVPEREIEKVWPSSELPGVEKITTLAGYVPLGAERIAAPRPEARPLDVVYRGRELPYWIGRLGQEKAFIGREFLARAPTYGLACDIDWREAGRLNGRAWTDLLRSGRATLATESGASITDFDGSLQRTVDQYLRRHPMASFEEVHAAILAPHEGNVMMNIASPRIFEAIALRTALVLFPGEYSGVVEPDRHYIPLEKDFSNFDTVVERIRDTAALREMTERAHAEIVASGRYSIKTFVDRFDRALDDHADARTRRAAHRRRLILARAERPLDLAYARFSDGVERSLRKPSLVDVGPKIGLILGFVATSPELRELLRAFVALSVQLRRPVAPIGLFLADLLRVGLMRRIARGHRDSSAEIRIEGIVEGDNLTLRTAVGSNSAPTRSDVAGAPFRRLYWDHSVVGTAVRPQLVGPLESTVMIGEAGVYRFHALEAIAVRAPEVVSAAVGFAVPEVGR